MDLAALFREVEARLSERRLKLSGALAWEMLGADAIRKQLVQIDGLEFRLGLLMGIPSPTALIDNCEVLPRLECDSDARAPFRIGIATLRLIDPGESLGEYHPAKSLRRQFDGETIEVTVTPAQTAEILSAAGQIMSTASADVPLRYDAIDLVLRSKSFRDLSERGQVGKVAVRCIDALDLVSPDLFIEQLRWLQSELPKT